MLAWIQDLDAGQRRVLVTLAAVLGALALATGVVVLADDEPDEATVQTDDDGTTTQPRASSATSSSSSSTTSASSSTSTTAVSGGLSVTQTTRRSAAGGTTTTRRPTATVPPATTAPPTTPPSGGPCNTGGGSAGQMANRFCAHRANLGLPTMTRNGALDQMAQEWAAKMAADGALSHRPNAEGRAMVAARCDCPGWAENVAYDTTVQGAWDAWLASGVHRTNIEDPRAGEYGMGVGTSVVDGVQYLWFVQVFGRYG